MKKITFLFLLAATMLFSFAILHADQAAATPATAGAKKQSKCPVMGGEINRQLFVDVEGKRVYLCCRGCGAALRKEPKKYLRQMAAEGVTAEDAPKPEAATTETK